MVWGGARLYIEPSKEDLPDFPVPPIHEGFISMVKTHIQATAHVVEPFKTREFDIKEKNLLKGLDPEAVTGIDGNPPTSLLGERSPGQLIRGSRNFSQNVCGHRLRNVFGESNPNLTGLTAHKVHIRLI